MKKKVLSVLLGLLVTAGFSLTATAHADENCQRVRGKLFEEDIQFPCQIDPAFDGCFLLRMRGTFRSLRAFTQNEWFVDLQQAGIPIPEASFANYNRELHVFSNRRGTVTGDVQYVFDLRIFDVGGGFVASAIITEGTGIYEGASGWIVSTFTDATLQEAIVRGRVCGPNIPRHRDDDDEGEDE